MASHKNSENEHFCFALIFIYANLAFPSVIKLEDDIASYPLGDYYKVYIDSSSQKNINDITQLSPDDYSIKGLNQIKNESHTYWLRIDVKKQRASLSYFTI